MFCECVEIKTYHTEKVRSALECIGFDVQTTMNGWDAKNGAFSVRIVPGVGVESNGLTLVVNTHEPQKSFDSLVEKVGEIAIITTAEEHDCEYILSSICEDLQIRFLWIYNEDDKKELPPLTHAMEWETSADRGIRNIISYIPLAFRVNSRIRIAKVAEDFAKEANASTVTDRSAIKGIIFGTPSFDHKALQRSIKRFFTYEDWIDDVFAEAAAEQVGKNK